MNVASATRNAAVLLSLVASACTSSTDAAPAGAIAAIASESLAVRAPSSATATPPAPEKPGPRRPGDSNDLILTPSIRARLEHFAPEARGFTTSLALEEALYKLQLKRGVDADAVKALDRLAKGKWVLFTGNIGGVTPGTFQLPIRYTPKDQNDPLGLTSVWVSIEFTNINGYDSSKYQPGELTAILARYDGKLKATTGYDTILLDHWFE